jgi:hypothetical protein
LRWRSNRRAGSRAPASQYSPDQVSKLCELYLASADRDQLDPILDGCVDSYKLELDEDGQVDFNGAPCVIGQFPRRVPNGVSEKNAEPRSQQTSIH